MGLAVEVSQRALEARAAVETGVGAELAEQAGAVAAKPAERAPMGEVVIAAGAALS